MVDLSDAMENPAKVKEVFFRFLLNLETKFLTL
jgi:hypothetical protein